MDFGMPFLLECPSIESACALCAKLGLQFVELNLSFPLCNLDALTAQRLNSLCAQYGLYFTFHLDEELAPCAFDSRVRAAYVDCALRAITLARETGTPTVNLHWPRGVYVTLPDRVTYLFENYREDYLQNTRQFRDVCTQASEGHVNICVENTNGFLPFQQEAVDMLLESPAFGLTLDIGHDYTAHSVDAPYYARHADRLRHMHAHDAQGNHCHLPFGGGDMDWPAQLRRAQQAGARAVIEVKTIAALRESVALLRETAL